MTAASPIDLDRLLLIAGGHTAFQLLWAGVELGVFDRLSAEPGLTRKQLAEKIGLGEYPARVLLTGLTALGLILKQGERYTNAPSTPGKITRRCCARLALLALSALPTCP